MFGRKNEPAKDTTATVLERLQSVPFENVVVRAGDTRFLISTAMLKRIIWDATPDGIKDENSAQAKEWALFRTGLKTFIRPFLPGVIKKFFGDVEMEPRLNILTWLSQVIPLFAVNFLASQEWNIHVKQCESCESSVFQIVGVSSSAGNLIVASSSPSAAAAIHANLQSIQGRGDDHPLGQADSDESGRPVGDLGNHRERQDDIGQGASEETTGSIPGGEGVRLGYQAVG